MNYISTRDANLKKIQSAYAIKAGISRDGGLFVPSIFPKVFPADLLYLSYRERADILLSTLLTDFTKEEIRDCTEKAYGGNKFDAAEIAPLIGYDPNAVILELWHGPTCAFKDMALQILPHLLEKAVKKTGDCRTVSILVATSGDTGKAALEGFKDVEGTKITVFYPQNGVSEIQRLQMATQQGNNVRVFAVKGNFDDAQSGVKKIFGNMELNQKLSEAGYLLSSANSINWGRLAPQIIYYYSAYCDLLQMGRISVGDFVNIAVPTGNFGNILAAYYARKMGLPIKKLICASNKNNILTDFFKTGEYNRNRGFYTTNSPSMDILISSNLERLLFDLSGNDADLIRGLMNHLAETGVYRVSSVIHKKLQELFYADYCDDAQTLETIGDTFEKRNILLDTHTAVALNVYKRYRKKTGDQTQTVIASTANPFKFSENVLQAVSPREANLNGFAAMRKLQEVTGVQAPGQLMDLAEKEIRFHEVLNVNEMPGVLEA